MYWVREVLYEMWSSGAVNDKMRLWAKQPPLKRQITCKFKQYAWTYWWKDLSIQNEVSFFLWAKGKVGQAIFGTDEVFLKV